MEYLKTSMLIRMLKYACDIQGDDLLIDADEYCEWKNKHQGSKWCRWQYTEIEAITRRLSEAEMQNDYSYSEE